MNLLFVGDIHGSFLWFKERVVDAWPNHQIIQVGDFGIGFPHTKIVPNFGVNVHFIRGNHDNPEIAKKHPNYLGDYGYNEELGVFYVGGGDSIDKFMRIEGISWWRDEELSIAELTDCLDLYDKIRPQIVVTHDCPTSIRNIFLKVGKDEQNGTRTNQALQQMFEIHHPQLWVFGHHHANITIETGGTLFRCIHIKDLMVVNETTLNRYKERS